MPAIILKSLCFALFALLAWLGVATIRFDLHHAVFRQHHADWVFIFQTGALASLVAGALAVLVPMAWLTSPGWKGLAKAIGCSLAVTLATGLLVAPIAAALGEFHGGVFFAFYISMITTLVFPPNLAGWLIVTLLIRNILQRSDRIT